MSKKSVELGEFELLVVLAILKAGGKTYGLEIKDQLKTAIAREVSVGALYTTLERLEKKGFVRSEIGEPTAQRGGRAKKFYEVTPDGRQATKRQKQNLETMWQGVAI